MSKRNRKSTNRKKGKLLPFIIFHRWAGLSSFILLAALAITGIMLNHTEELNLDESYINNSWLQTWYGIKMPKQQNFIKPGSDYLVQVGKQIYFNQSRLADEDSPLVGAYTNDNFIVIAMRDAVYLLTFEGELIEKLDSESGLPVPVSGMGFSDQKNISGSYFLKLIIITIPAKMNF